VASAMMGRPGRRDGAERGIEEEVRFHLDQRTEDVSSSANEMDDADGREARPTSDSAA